MNFCIQFLDLDILWATCISHQMDQPEFCQIQRWLRKFEAIFESSAMVMLQIVYWILREDTKVDYRNLSLPYSIFKSKIKHTNTKLS